MRSFCYFFALPALLLLLPGMSFADAQVLFEPTSQIPAEGGPGEKLAFFPGGTELLSGGIGVISVGDDAGLGLAGYSLASEYVPVHDGVKYDVGYSYWGLVLDRSFFTHKLCYIRTSIIAGPAQGWAVARVTGADRVYANFAQIEPGIDIMLNVTHELRIGLGADWRFCAGADVNGLLGTDLGGGALTLTIMYGQN